MLMLWSPEYFTRLWCCFEIGVFLDIESVEHAKQLEIIPLFEPAQAFITGDSAAPSALVSASCRHRCDTGHTSIGTSDARRNPSFHDACALGDQETAIQRHAANASSATNTGDRSNAG